MESEFKNIKKKLIKLIKLSPNIESNFMQKFPKNLAKKTKINLKTSPSNCNFCQKLNSRISSYYLLKRALYQKFSLKKHDFFLKTIQNLIKKKYSEKFIRIKDKVLFLEKVENLTEFFQKKDSLIKLDFLKKYYKFHKDIPRFFSLNNLIIIYTFFDEKRRIDYKNIRKILAEEESIYLSGFTKENSFSYLKKEKNFNYSILLNESLIKNSTFFMGSRKNILIEDNNTIEKNNFFNKKLKVLKNKIDENSTIKELNLCLNNLSSFDKEKASFLNFKEKKKNVYFDKIEEKKGKSKGKKNKINEEKNIFLINDDKNIIIEEKKEIYRKNQNYEGSKIKKFHKESWENSQEKKKSFQEEISNVYKKSENSNNFVMKLEQKIENLFNNKNQKNEKNLTQKTNIFLDKDKKNEENLKINNFKTAKKFNNFLSKFNNEREREFSSNLKIRNVRLKFSLSPKKRNDEKLKNIFKNNINRDFLTPKNYVQKIPEKIITKNEKFIENKRNFSYEKFSNSTNFLSKNRENFTERIQTKEKDFFSKLKKNVLAKSEKFSRKSFHSLENFKGKISFQKLAINVSIKKNSNNFKASRENSSNYI